MMCSENAVNGQPTCANSWAMTTVARESWGFEGYVTGDCGAVDVVFAPYPTTHNFTADTALGHLGHGYTLPQNKSLQSAGLDIDCTRANLSLALGTAADTDAALRHLWAVQLRLGRFDPLSASPHNALGWESMGTAQHQQLALEAARQSTTLLKNVEETLPISEAEPKRIAILGPTAEIRSGGYSGRGTGGPFTASTAESISRYAKASANVVPGCVDVSCADGGGIAAAVAAAAEADLVVVAVGISSDGDVTDRYEVGKLLVELDLLLVVLDLVLLVLHLVVQLRDLLLVHVDLRLDHARFAEDGVGRHPAREQWPMSTSRRRGMRGRWGLREGPGARTPAARSPHRRRRPPRGRSSSAPPARAPSSPLRLYLSSSDGKQ